MNTFLKYFLTGFFHFLEVVKRTVVVPDFSPSIILFYFYKKLMFSRKVLLVFFADREYTYRTSYLLNMCIHIKEDANTEIDFSTVYHSFGQCFIFCQVLD